MNFSPFNNACKLLIAITLIASSSNRLFAQYKWIAVNADHIAYDANGPIGDCLFPMDDEGNITLQEVVKTDISKDSTTLFVTEFLKNKDNEDGISVSTPVITSANSNITCDVEMNVGKELFEVPYAGMMERHVSQISFKVLIELKDGRFRYTLTDFYTNRRSIHGGAKSEGPSNLIHWQRVNSLTKERDEYEADNIEDKNSRKQKKVQGFMDDMKEFNDQIAKEIKSYEDEFDAVQSFISGLKNCCISKVEEEDW